MMRTPLLGLLLGSLLLACRPAAAAPPNRAKQLFDSGTTHYNLGEYQDALRDFKDAYRLVRQPALLFNVAQCYRQLGDPASAAQFYRAFRREMPDSPNRAEVDRLIVEMDKAAAKAQRDLPPTGVQPPPAHVGPTAAPSRPDLTLTATAPRRDERPLVKKAWFWAVLGGAAAVVAAGVAVGVVFGVKNVDPTPTAGAVAGN